MSTQDAPRIGPQQALQSYLDELLQEATDDRPVRAEDFLRPQAVPASARPVAEPQVLEPRPLVLPTIKLTDIKLVEAPVAVIDAPVPAAPVAVSTPSEPEPLAPVAVPVVEAPAKVEAPVVAAPQVEAPVALPAVEAPVVASPVAESPVVAQPVVEAPVAPPVVEVPVVAAPVVSAPVAEVAAPVAPPRVQPAEAKVQAPLAEPVVAAAVPPLPPKVVAGRPEWGEQRFECLLFDVAGLTLAVPLVCLGTIHSLEGQTLTPLFGQPDWFLGMLKTHSGNIKVIDTARWVMPERYRDEFRDNLSFVITIQGFDWGLAVHKVDRSIHLHPDQVKWRSLRTQRPWLAGTVIEHMCALLDVASLADLIESGALKRAR